MSAANEYSVPGIRCGQAYPWTQRKLDGVAELADAVEELSTYEREQLSELMPHLINQTPRTDAAGFKVAAIIRRVSGPARRLLEEAIVNVAVEGGKRAMGL